jgi:hypothetical protein
MEVNLLFLILIMWSKATIGTEKNEFRLAIFKKLSNKKSIFLWQLSFYILKRFHIIVLAFMFVYGLQEFNVFYIGLLYFLIMYISSLATYRKSKYMLVAYASFFIWIQYLWSLLTKTSLFNKSSMVYKIMTMITL